MLRTYVMAFRFEKYICKMSQYSFTPDSAAGPRVSLTPAVGPRSQQSNPLTPAGCPAT